MKRKQTIKRFQTKSEVEADRNRIDSERTVLRLALQYVLTANPDAIESYCIGDDLYVWSLYGAQQAHGGIVIERFRCDSNRNDGISAHYFESFHSEVMNNSCVPLPIKQSMERLRRTRDRILDEKGYL